MLERFPGSAFPTSVEPTTYTLPDGTNGTYLLCQADRFRSLLAADVPKSVAALMIATQRPINLAALNEPLTSAAWTSKPSWQIRPLQDPAIPVDEYRFEADRAHSHVMKKIEKALGLPEGAISKFPPSWTLSLNAGADQLSGFSVLSEIRPAY